MKVPLPPFEPDKAGYNVGAAAYVLNALPIPDGWGPMPGLVEVTPQTVEEGAIETITGCTGAFYARSPSGSTAIFAGTQTKLYLFNATDLVWEDVTRASGGDYNGSLPWSFSQFGSRVIATNGTDEPQKFDVGSDLAFEDLAGTPPIARIIRPVGAFLVAVGIDGSPSLVQWSGVEDSEQWATLVAGADGQDQQIGADVMNIVPTTGGAVIFLRSAIRSMTFSPESSYVFSFSDITIQRGLASPYGVAQIGQDDFVYYSAAGFYRVNTPIGAKRVDQWFSEFLDQDFIEDIQAVVDPFRQVCWFRFRAVDGETYLLGYDWQIDRWCLSSLALQALATVATPAITIDGMDNYFETIDDIDVPFDSRFWRSEQLTFGGVTEDGRLGYLAGGNLAATLYTAEVSPADPDRFFVNGARVDTDAVDHTLTLGTSDYNGQTITYRSVVTPSSRTRFCGVRGDGRFLKFKLDIPSGSTWTAASSIDFFGTAGAKS